MKRLWEIGKIYFFLLFLAIVVFLIIGYISINLSHVLIIDANGWLIFFGALFGSVVTVLGAYFATYFQRDLRSTEVQTENSDIVLLLLQNEFFANQRTFRDKYLPFDASTKVRTFGNECLFETADWKLFRLEIIKMKNKHDVQSLINLYNFFEQINVSIQHGPYMMGAGLQEIMFNNLQSYFSEVETIYDKMESQFDDFLK